MIGLDADQTPATANQYLKQLAAVYQELRDAEGVNLRLQGIAHDRQTFLASLDALRVRLDGEVRTPSNATTMQAEVDRLVRRLNDAQQIQSQRKVVQAEADRAKEEVDAATSAIEELEGTLQLREDAGVAEESEISAAVEKSNDRRRLQELAEQARSNIHQQARGQPLDSFLADAQAAREGLEVRLVELQGRVEPLDAEISQQAVVADSARRQLEEWSKASRGSGRLQAGNGVANCRIARSNYRICGGQPRSSRTQTGYRTISPEEPGFDARSCAAFFWLPDRGSLLWARSG